MTQPDAEASAGMPYLRACQEGMKGRLKAGHCGSCT